MQGIRVDGHRPNSKKAVKEAIAADPTQVFIERTSEFGDEYEGTADELPQGKKVNFVGPDPFKSRKFYGTIIMNLAGKLVVQ